MMFCVWPLYHSVAEIKRGVVDTAYQGREGRHSSQEGRQRRANRKGELPRRRYTWISMHGGIGRERPQPAQVERRGSERR
jgi:hypothetical protein